MGFECRRSPRVNSSQKYLKSLKQMTNV